MAIVTTDEWIGALLGGKPSAPARPTDDELLAGLAPGQTATPQAVTAPALAPTPTAPVSATEPADPEDAPPVGEVSSSPRQSRVDALLSSLQAPTRGEHAMAAMFDSLFGGNRYQDDVRGRRNQYDQALLGAHAADASAAERAAEAERSRGMQDRQFKLQERAQNLADERAKEDRVLRNLLSERAVGAANQRQTARDEAALERAKIVKGGSGTAMTPEQSAERDAAASDAEAAYLAGRASMPGKSEVTIDMVKQFRAGELPDGTLSPEQLESLRRGVATLAGMKSLDQKEYVRTLKAGESRESGLGDKIGTSVETKKLDPVRMSKARQELLEMAAPIRDAINSWTKLSPEAKEILARYGGSGESALMARLKSASLSDEEQVAAARIQRLINIDVKKFAGSAVTGSEWGRQATAIGLADFDPWKSPAVLNDYLRKTSAAYKALKDDYQATYPEIFKQGGAQ